MHNNLISEPFINHLRSAFHKDIARIPTPEYAAQWIKKGSILVYPTETFYAIGCLASCENAVKEIFKIKKRQCDKPLPLLGADRENLLQAVSLDGIPEKLMKNFWPGALSIIVKARKNLCKYLKNQENTALVRISGSSKARAIAKISGYPVVSTSANLSGSLPVTSSDNLGNDFLLALSHSAIPAGIADWQEENCINPGRPSTIVQVLSPSTLLILRHGVIDKKALEAQDYKIIENNV